MFKFVFIPANVHEKVEVTVIYIKNNFRKNKKMFQECKIVNHLLSIFSLF